MYGHLCAVTAPECGQPHRSGKLTCAAHSSLEERWRYYEAQGSYRRKQRMRSNGEDYEARSATCRGSITSGPRSGSCCVGCLLVCRLLATRSHIEHHRALCDPRTFWHHGTLCVRGPCCHVRGALACGGFGNNIINTTTPHMCTYGSLVWMTCTNHK